LGVGGAGFFYRGPGCGKTVSQGQRVAKEQEDEESEQKKKNDHHNATTDIQDDNAALLLSLLSYQRVTKITIDDLCMTAASELVNSLSS
jgi:hypothetical protein